MPILYARFIWGLCLSGGQAVPCGIEGKDRRERVVSPIMLDKLVHNRWPRVGAALFGSLLLALAINLFIVPQHLYTSGLLALCTVSNSLFLSIIPIPAEPIIPDMLTSCLVGGILAGFSNGLVLTCGASCGGLDILGLYLSKKGRGFTVGKFSLLFNAALYTLCLILFSAPTAIYSAIYTVFNALFVDRVHQQNITTQVLIVTKLRDLEPFWELGRKMDRGITYWTGHGAYTGDEVQILCICLSKYEIETLQQEVQKIDSHAFFMMQEGVHTRGNFKRHLNP